MKAIYVKTEEGRYLVQVEDNSPWGFRLEDDELSWPGGFGAGAGTWERVKAVDVPRKVREQLGTLSSHLQEDN